MLMSQDKFSKEVTPGHQWKISPWRRVGAEGGQKNTSKWRGRNCSLKVLAHMELGSQTITRVTWPQAALEGANRPRSGVRN